MPSNVGRHYTCAEDGSVIVRSGFRGLWIKTHACVAIVACPYCDAAKGEPCRRTSGHPGSSTHVLRRQAAAKRGIPHNQRRTR